MVEIDLDIEMSDVDIDKEGLLDELAEGYAKQIEDGGIDCPKDGCDSKSFDAEVWTTDEGGFEGAAVCLKCNSRTNFDFEDSGVKDGIQELEDSLENLF
ncbi:hypothetical protein [Halomontanus rarus]|uniref:hypothetical protein n=1 Tax=Halomontanus rarus TaxID=3034020 RepID=UPI0023E8D6AD|nr:hypothetical protein [Halovivax sp. TS33]